MQNIYVRVPDMEIGRTTKEGLTANKLFDSNLYPQKICGFRLKYCTPSFNVKSISSLNA